MKNHFIPCFYSKRWVSSADHKLIQYTRPYIDLVSRRRFPSQVGFEIDLYTLPGLKGKETHLLENNFFREIDQNASNILDKFEHTSVNDLSVKERHDWAVFLISLRQRNSEKIFEIASRAQETFEKNIPYYKKEYENRRLPDDYSTFDDYIESLKNNLWFERTNKLLVRDAILIPRSTKAIVSFVWAVIRTQAPAHEFLTSDRPLITTNGIEHKEGHLALPLGPRRLFIAAHSQNAIDEMVNDKALSENSNRIIVRQARKEVYSSSEQTKFIAKRFRF